jgi:hypothetical protein
MAVINVMKTLVDVRAGDAVARVTGVASASVAAHSIGASGKSSGALVRSVAFVDIGARDAGTSVTGNADAGERAVVVEA